MSTLRTLQTANVSLSFRYVTQLTLSSAPTDACCDNCDGMPVDVDIANDSRPSTPDSGQDLNSAHTTPSKNPDENGKRKLASGPRRGPHLERARFALEKWRFDTKRSRYTPSSTTMLSLLPDNILRSLASARDLHSAEEIDSRTSWIYSFRHGEDVLGVLERVDKSIVDERNTKTQAKKDETAARQLVKRLQEKAERDEKARAKALECEAKRTAELRAKQDTALMNQKKKVIAELLKRHHAANKPTGRAKGRPAAKKARLTSTPLNGCSVFNSFSPPAIPPSP